MAFISVGCTQTVTVPYEEERNGATVVGPTPAAYCGTAKVIAGPTALVSGTAEYQVRPVSAGGILGNENPQSQMAANTHPIRFAEVRITNAAGTLIQCTETLADGTFSFLLSTTGANYTIAVNSRVKNSNETINIFDKPETNRLYSIGGLFNPTVLGALNPTMATTLELVAPVTNPTVLGAAFNILDKIILANEFLRAKTLACGVPFSGCVPFTVAHSADVYWTPGFNPGEYFGWGPTSFYLPGYYRMFILGGLNGDINNTDTDHFDNSVVLHEYGHFLEDTVFGSDSPGGEHNGNKVIDPRLAWSEGWGNFIQSAVLVDAGILASPKYQDTRGNTDGTGANAFNADLEDVPASALNLYDYPSYFGEGIFREFSVARMLNDVIDDTFPVVETEVWGEGARTDDITNNFPALWAGLTKTLDFGFSDPDTKFRNVGQLHAAVAAVAGADDWTNMRGVERHIGDTSEYAQYVKTGLGCLNTGTITPTAVAGDNGSFSTSHLLLNNDYYHVKLTSSGKITLVYLDADGVGTEADLDLYVYNTSARLGNTADIVTSAYHDPDANPVTAQTEAGPKTLGAGSYLINVFVYTGGVLGGAVNYQLKLGSQILCPDDLPN